MAQIAEQVLDKIILFNLNCSLFHGNRRLSAADIQSALHVNINMDKSKEVMSLGVKRVFDKKELAKLSAVKGAMQRACALVGAPLLGGYAVPEHRAKTLAYELDQLVVRGIAIKADLLRRYQSILDEFAKANPTWEHIIKGNAFDKSYVEGQIQFDWSGIRVAPADDGGVMSQGLESKVGGLLGNLLTDIAKAANHFMTESLSGRDGVTRKAFRPLAGMADKLDGFKFIDMRVGKLADMIRHVLSVMPPEGRIEGADLRNILGLSSILCNPDSALGIAQKVADADVLTVYDSEFGKPYLSVADPRTVNESYQPEPAAPLIEVTALTGAIPEMTIGMANSPILGYTPPPALNLFGF